MTYTYKLTCYYMFNESVSLYLYICLFMNLSVSVLCICVCIYVYSLYKFVQYKGIMIPLKAIDYLSPVPVMRNLPFCFWSKKFKRVLQPIPKIIFKIHTLELLDIQHEFQTRKTISSPTTIESIHTAIISSLERGPQ